MQTLHPRLGVEFSGRQKTQNANFASKVWALNFRQAEDPDCKLCIPGLGLEFLGRQKTQNANFAPKVWALNFRQAEDTRIHNLHPRFGP